MRVEAIKDVTLTVKAGQIVDVPDGEARAALALGLARIPEEKKPETEKKPEKKTKKGAAK